MDIPEEFIEHVIKSAQESFFGNKLLSDKRKATNNSRRTDPWDDFNTNLSKETFNNRFIYIFTDKSIWEYAIAIDKKTKNLFLFFQENRIKNLKKDINRGKRTHYLCMFVKEYNRDIPLQIEQINLFNNNDEDVLLNKMKKIKEEFNLNQLEIKCAVCILFNPSKEILNISSMRAVIFDSNLDIYEEKDFTKNIYFEQDIPLDKVDKNDNLLANEPNNGLGLTKRALERKSINDNNLKINKKLEEKEV